MARFAKGMPKPKGSGRKKGTPNKASQTIAEALGDKGFDIAEEAIKLYRGKDQEKRDLISAELKFKILALLAEYSLVKPKALEAPPAPPEERPDSDTPTSELLRRVKSGGI